MDPALVPLYEASLDALRRARPRLRPPRRAGRRCSWSRATRQRSRPTATTPRRALPGAGAGVARGRRAAGRRAGARRRACAPTGSRPAARCRRPPRPARGRSGRASRRRASVRDRRRTRRARARGARRAGRTPSWSPPARGRRPRSARRPAPVAPLWGVVARCGCPTPPRHTLEQAGVEALTEPGGGPASLFSIVTAGGVSAVGSTFMPDEPDPAAIAPLLLERGARYLPGARAARRSRRVRACARPLSADGRPLLGAGAGRRGPAPAHRPRRRGASRSGRGRRSWWRRRCSEAPEIPPELAAARFGAP